MDRRRTIGLLFILLLVGCAGSHDEPAVMIQRQMYAPPKPADCAIKVVNISMGEVGPLTPYDWLGSLIISTRQGFDPFDPQAIKAIRPAVCQLGGEQVSLGTQAATANGGTVMYLVSKRREPVDDATQTAAPTPARPASAQ